MITVLRTEVKLLLRHWGVWVVLAAVVLLGYDVGRSNTMATLATWIDESIFRFYLLGPLLLTVSAGRRARTDRVHELIDAMPYAVPRWVLGRYLAHWAVWLVFSLTCWLVPALFLLWRGEPIGVPTLALHYLAAAPVSVALCTAVGFTLGHMPGPSMAGYFVAIAYYFAAVFGVMLSSPDGAAPWMFLDILAPQRYLPLTATGYFPNTALVLLNRAFAMAVAAGLGALTILLISHRRRLPAVLAATALLLAGVTAVASAAGTLGELADRSSARAAEAREMLSAAKAPPAASGSIQVDQYDLSVTFAPASHGLSVSGGFTVTNPAPTPLPQIDLTLRANLVVEQVLGPDGGAVPFQQAGNRLSVTQPLRPGEAVRLSATWTGTVWHWRKDTSHAFEGWSLGAHVSPNSIFLPASYGWYPMADEVELYWANGAHQIFDLAPRQSTASFAVTTHGTDLAVISNAGAPVPGLYIVGTALPTTVVDGVAYTVAPATLRQAAAVVKELRPRAELLGQTAAVQRVIELPEGVGLGLETATELRITPGAVLVHTQDPEWGKAVDNLAFLSSRWWTGFLSPWVVSQELGAYMEWVVTGEKLSSGSNSAQIMDALITVDETKGRDAALDLLHALYAQSPEGIRYEDVAKALQLPPSGR